MEIEISRLLFEQIFSENKGYDSYNFKLLKFILDYYGIDRCSDILGQITNKMPFADYANSYWILNHAHKAKLGGLKYSIFENIIKSPMKYFGAKQSILNTWGDYIKKLNLDENGIKRMFLSHINKYGLRGWYYYISQGYIISSIDNFMSNFDNIIFDIDRNGDRVGIITLLMDDADMSFEQAVRYYITYFSKAITDHRAMSAQCGNLDISFVQCFSKKLPEKRFYCILDEQAKNVGIDTNTILKRVVKTIQYWVDNGSIVKSNDKFEIQSKYSLNSYT